MKSLLSRLMGLMLALCLLSPAASAESNAAIPEIAAQYMFVRHDAIHALNYNGMLYQRHADGWVSMGHLYDSVWAIDSDGENVWLVARLENDQGSWYELRRATFDARGILTGSEALCEIKWKVNGDNWPQFYGLVMEGDAAYIAVNSEDWLNRELYRVDPASGEAVLILTDSLSKITRYKDGLLLAERST